MGIESIGSVGGTVKYQAPSATVKQVTETVPDTEKLTDKNDDAVLRTARNLASKEADKEKSEAEKQPETTMKDVNSLNKIINRNTVAEFSINEPTNRIAIKIKDKDTNELIREIPSEKALEMLAKAWELAGIMVDEKR